MTSAGGFQAGDYVLVRDPRGRELLVRLEPGETINTHRGRVEHDRIIGRESGSTVESLSGSELLVIEPSFSDLIFNMPRGAQIIYPKDLAAILGQLSLYPGVHVLEAGIGSGALTLALLRAGCTVTSVEKRDDFANQALKNLNSFARPLLDGFTLIRGDIAEIELDGSFDRVVLDLLNPWDIVPIVEPRLRRNGHLVVYVTNIVQVQQTVTALRGRGMLLSGVKEVLERDWVVAGEVIRPEQKMVGHTGFIVTARPRVV